jgi:hypothetical protein
MVKRIHVPRAVVLVVTVIATLALMQGPAFAAPPVYYGYGYAYTTGAYGEADTNSAGRYIEICDTVSDGYSAYVWFNSGTSTHTPTDRLETSGGNGTCKVSYLNYSEITFHVCRDIPSNPDNCAPWISVKY